MCFEVNKPFGVPCYLCMNLFSCCGIFIVISNGWPSLSAVRCVVPPPCGSHQLSPLHGTRAMSTNTGSRILADFIIRIHMLRAVNEEFYGLLYTKDWLKRG
jgi:hypothetical protein